MRTGLLGLAGAAALSLSLQVAQPSQAEEGPEFLFANVRIFDGQSAALSEPTNVLVRGNQIAAIGAAAKSTNATVIKGGGRTLMPGLIDNHVHITMSSWSQSEAMADGMTSAKLEVRAAEQAEAMLMRGFTAARDLGGPVWGLKAGIDAGKYKGPRVWPSGAMISQTSGHGDGRLPSERSRR